MDQAQFLQLIDGHQGIIHKICRLYRDSKEDREDLFQEIVFQLWKSAPSFKGEAQFSSWLYRVALTTAIAGFRKKQVKITYTDVLPEKADVPVNRDEQERFFAALKQLDDGDKALIALYLENMSYQQIAEIMGITENYVGVKLNRIKTKIQQLLKLI
ncbi:RNA polymerase sigma-70 factor, ECF subfamily [Filimonas lacunae]|uniref:RNA polymerase sigma-70 factor, ECF subfamily n=1 Tax=Filimonas lacunae TaxID=477680 RepID=A0A173MMG0_9BACT|nr:sigma-70 family RNA polymerase sigma factor [Filimonas lacunae]BAV08835.1 RNA polymerase ECF-type sigma factor [Filimonas lacunae]SIS62533.1 RNA polymerase sigma-70 factor, ECF subfamily [Filimonas lacunae]